MYHCHTQLYFIGGEEALFAPLRAMPPLEYFTHSFRESREPEEESAAGADLILADLRSLDAARAVRDLTRIIIPPETGCVLVSRNRTHILMGEIGSVREGERVADWLRKRGIAPIFLSDGPLIDIGGILPLMEER